MHNSDIEVSHNNVFPFPSILMYFLFSHLAHPTAHTPALHILSSSLAANADGSFQRTGACGGRCYPCVPPRIIKFAPVGQLKRTRLDETLFAGTQVTLENKTPDHAILFTTVRPLEWISVSPRVQSAVESNWHVFYGTEYDDEHITRSLVTVDRPR